MNKKSQWQPVFQTAKAPEIFDIPFVTAQNMNKLIIYPSGHTLNVLHSVRNMSALGQFHDITHSYPKPQKPQKVYFSQILWIPFRSSKIVVT